MKDMEVEDLGTPVKLKLARAWDRFCALFRWC